MRVLVTGGDGLLGSNLVRLLLERGHEVRVLVQAASKSKTLDGLNIVRFTGDILEPSSIDSAMTGAEAVIHLAASTSVWPSKSKLVCKVNIEGTRNMIEASFRHRIKRMIFIGSASSINEKYLVDGEYCFPCAHTGLDYIDSKSRSLQLVIEAYQDKALPVLAILPTFMIGPYDSLPSSGKMIVAMAKNKIRFYTNGGKNFVHVNDVAAAVANSLEAGRLGKIYIAGNENLTYKEFFSKLAAVIGKPAPRIRIPDWLVKTVGFNSSALGYLTGRAPMLSWHMACISCKKTFSYNKLANIELHMPNTPIEEGIRKGYNWFVENQYLPGNRLLSE